MRAPVVFLMLAVASSHAFHKSESPSLFGSVAVVTGGAQGIGRAICENYLKNGVKTVIIVDKNKHKGLEAQETLCRKYGANRAFFFHADVTKPEDLIVFYKFVVEKIGCINIFVSNAGIVNETNPVLTMSTNALAPMLWIDKFYELMREDNGKCKGGTFVVMSSNLSYLKTPFLVNYQCSNRAIVPLVVAKGHLWNYWSTKVRVYGINAGLTYTDMTKAQMVLNKDVEIFEEFKKNSLWQTADAVGRGNVILHKIGKTGCMYTIEGGKFPHQSPDSIDVVINYKLKIGEPRKSKEIQVLPIFKTPRMLVNFTISKGK